MSFAPRWILIVLCAVSCSRTDDATDRCHAQMASAQATLKEIDSSSLQSVNVSLTAVNAALRSCTVAQREGEVSELRKARDQLFAHQQLLEHRVSKKATAKLTPDELERLVKNGDPSCPKGQAYKHGDSGKEVRCTGLQPIAMNYAQAKEFYTDRGFKLKDIATPPALEAEYGGEKYVFHFDRVDSLNPPVCLTLYPRPGMSWQEAVARTTGARPDRMQGKNTVDTPRGTVALRVVETLHKLIVHLGQCSPYVKD